ncbi:lytic polysaccharide monooxygenase [Lophiostoma macrostomum CBS 122681]|uniref:Lytic polysaccharide monooxygenase n=1 Tax=Lophiostoma macrostomum CBS 122681 TaxID=1314788 RepID=A0A6A6TA61_9PLEO|nr:lytic polysaccharide monooxygenase [Lophiostoma macrostomum CBS 122681]
MFGKLSTVGVALVALAPSASAHMIMANPVPYGSKNAGTPDNSPLGIFPCKGVVSPVQQENKWAVGSSVKLSFTGSAVHGGGSCQISVTKDRTPTASSKFKVIYSIEGGCPGVNGPSEFDIPIPKELPNGEMSMAWTWFNKIGNREIYMNCAPITVSGGASSDDDFNSLPDMAIANIAPNASCVTPESDDYIFENPGKYSTRIGSGPFAPLCGGAASSGGGGAAPTGGASASGGSGNNGLYTPPASEAQQTSQAVASSAPAQATSGPAVASSAPAQTSSAPAVATSAPAEASSSGGSGALTSTIYTMLTVTAPAGSSAAPSNGTGPLSTSQADSGAPAPSTGAASQPAATAVPSAQPSSAPSTPAGGSGTCSQDGQIVCQGETQFGICDHGSVVWQAVAAGTKCDNGAVVKRDFTHRAQRTSIF